MLLIAGPLLIAAGPETAVDAERAFAAQAQSDGQWAAFRAFAAPDALLFVPEPTNAQAWLKDRQEPPIAVMWWPGTTFPSCDRTLAINTGPWVRASTASVGTFTTVWRRQADGGWKWLLDHGRDTPAMQAVGPTPVPVEASCDSDRSSPAERQAEFAATEVEQMADWAAGEAEEKPAKSPHDGYLARNAIFQGEGAMPQAAPVTLPPVVHGDRLADGNSDDWTLAWRTHMLRDQRPGAHDLAVWQWRGAEGWKLVLYETVGLK